MIASTWEYNWTPDSVPCFSLLTLITLLTILKEPRVITFSSASLGLHVNGFILYLRSSFWASELIHLSKYLTWDLTFNKPCNLRVQEFCWSWIGIGPVLATAKAANLQLGDTDYSIEINCKEQKAKPLFLFFFLSRFSLFNWCIIAESWSCTTGTYTCKSISFVIYFFKEF